jgi:hypothetical protein
MLRIRFKACLIHHDEHILACVGLHVLGDCLERAGLEDGRGTDLVLAIRVGTAFGVAHDPLSLVERMRDPSNTGTR